MARLDTPVKNSHVGGKRVQFPLSVSAAYGPDRR